VRRERDIEVECTHTRAGAREGQQVRELLPVLMRCNALQCVVVWCSVLQCVAVRERAPNCARALYIWFTLLRRGQIMREHMDVCESAVCVYVCLCVRLCVCVCV